MSEPSEKEVEAVQNWLDDGCSSWGVPTQAIKKLCAAALARAEANAEGGGVVALEDHKWLDPECGVNGCQSLVWKSRYESAVKGRADFRQAYREARNAHPAPQPSGPVEALVRQIDALLAMNKTGQVSHRIPGLAVELLERSKEALSALTAGKPEQALPSGWKLVPEQPTQAMLDAGYYPAVQGRGCKSVWQVMLSAAPAAPTAGGGDA